MLDTTSRKQTQTPQQDMSPPTNNSVLRRTEHAVSSRNRQDLIHSLVSPHYVCNKFI